MNDGVKASDMALRILELVAFGHGPAGVTQIAEAVGIAKSAAFKHLQTLADHGFVVQDTTSARYRLGPKAWLLSRVAPPLDDVAGVAGPFMEAARSETGLAVVLSAPTRHSAFVLSTLTSTQPVEIGVRPGSELSLHASAQGKVHLAFGDPSLLDSLRDSALAPMTPRTITSYETLVAEIAAVRQRGYALAPEEVLLGVNAIAAPIYNYDDRLVASVCLIGSIQHLASDPQPEIVDRLLALARDISSALGSGATPRAPAAGRP